MESPSIAEVQRPFRTDDEGGDAHHDSRGLVDVTPLHIAADRGNGATTFAWRKVGRLR